MSSVRTWVEANPAQSNSISR